MNKTERDELRRIIRGKFKVLRSDVAQRKAELVAELETQIAEKFAADDKRWSDARFLIQQAVDEANRKINNIYRDLVGPEVWGGRADQSLVSARHVAQPTAERTRLARSGQSAIDAKVQAALNELERREVDLMTELATTALESAEAKTFMKLIPTVSELVPAARLLAAIDGPDVASRALGSGDAD